MADPAPGFAAHPDHTILIDEGGVPVTVTLNGAVVAATTDARILRENNYPPRAYVPREDVTATLTPTETTTHCPFKGDTVYYTVSAGGTSVTDSAWSYDDPFQEVRAIKGHVAFDEPFDVAVG